MLKIIVSLLILINPAVGYFAKTEIANLDASKNEALFKNKKLPISEDNIFLAAELLPIYPIRKWTVADPEISNASTTALVYETSHRLILFQKNDLTESRPIASLTKLMTGIVVIENADLDEVFTISKQAVATEGEMGNLKAEEQMTAKNLLYAMMVNSSNDAAVALSENLQSKGKNLVELMNEKARSLELKETYFLDPTGLNPENRSSARDLASLMQKALEYPLLSQMMRTPAIDISSADDKFHHHLTNTDKLLAEIPEVVGGKTGYTEEAGNCMVLAVTSPNGGGTLISVVMNANDRMKETKQLINWTKSAFFW